jgi:hypothetical protein
LLDDYNPVLWDAGPTLSLQGTAVTAGKIASSVTPEYSRGYEVLHIPVLADFSEGERVTIVGMRVRTYNDTSGKRYLGLDLNGDNIAEASDPNYYYTTSDSLSDKVAPYPVTDLAGMVNSTYNSIHLTWTPSPDYDIDATYYDRTLNRNGTETKQTTRKMLYADFTDTDVQLGDEITYALYTADGVAFSEKTEITVTVGEVEEEEAAAEEEVTEEEEIIPEEEEEAEEVTEEGATELSGELAELNRLFPYFKIRYGIHCQPADGMVIPSMCRFVTIELVYAQEKLDRDDELDVALTDRDLELTGKRLKFSERRYQAYCVEPEEPAGYCSALGKYLHRASYFLD